MTLKQAFKIWACAPRNTVLAAKSRDAVQRLLMKKWNDIELEQFTESFCRRIFYQSTESLEMKVKAASILVYLLQWGGDHGHCQRPTFTLAIAREEHERAEKDKARSLDALRLRENLSVPELDLTRIETDTIPAPCDEHGGALQEKTKNRRNMERQTRGRQPKSVVQIDATTHEVIKEWPSMTEAQKELNVCHIDVAVAKLRKAGGFYWSLAADADTFRQRLDEKLRQTDERQKEHAAKMREKKAGRPVKKGPVSKAGAAAEDLTVSPNDLRSLSDDDLMNELGRRGWQGELRRVQVISIGKE